MKNLNNYIIEKLKITKNMKNIPSVLENNEPDKNDLAKIGHNLFNTGEHSGFRKGVDIENMSVDDFLKDVSTYNDIDYKKYGGEIKKFAEKNDAEKLSLIFGTGYDGTWATVAFFQTNPYYYFIVYHSHYGFSEFIKAENEDDAFDEICNCVL